MKQVKQGHISKRWPVEKHKEVATSLLKTLGSFYPTSVDAETVYGSSHAISRQFDQAISKLEKLRATLSEQFWYEHPKEETNPYGGK